MNATTIKTPTCQPTTTQRTQIKRSHARSARTTLAAPEASPFHLGDDALMRLQQAIEQWTQSMLTKQRVRDRECPALSSTPSTQTVGVGWIQAVAPLIQLSLRTGLRKREALNVMGSDVSFDTATLTVRTDPCRTIPLDKEARRLLAHWQDTSSPFMPTHFIFPFATLPSGLIHLGRAWRTISAQAGLESMRWHDMRKHAIYEALLSGIAPQQVADAMGIHALDQLGDFFDQPLST